MSGSDLDIRIHADFTPPPGGGGSHPTSGSGPNGGAGTPPPLFNGQLPPGVSPGGGGSGGGGPTPGPSGTPPGNPPGGPTPPPLPGGLPPSPPGAPPVAVEGAAATLAIPGLGEAIVAVTITVEALVMAFDFLYDTTVKLDDAFQDIAQSTKRFNPTIATTTALGDVKLLMAEMRRANEIQEEISDYMDTRSDMAVVIRDLYTAVIKDLIPPVTFILEVARALLVIVKENYATVKEFVGGFLKGMASVTASSTLLSAIFGELNKIYNEILEHRRNLRKKRVLDQLQDLEDFANPKVQGNALKHNMPMQQAVRMFGR